MSDIGTIVNARKAAQGSEKAVEGIRKLRQEARATRWLSILAFLLGIAALVYSVCF